MKRSLSIVLLALAATASLAQAQEASNRAQSIEEARRNGDLLVPGEIGLPERQLYPGRYPALRAVAGKTRAEVRAELEAARRNGELLLPGEAGITAAQATPSAYPAQPVWAGKTQEQVRAETLQAIRDGDILAPGEAGITLRQLEPQKYLARGRSSATQDVAGTTHSPLR
jgi:hypothetical protein